MPPVTNQDTIESNANYNFPLLPKDAGWDERVLHFLKELPAWIIILIALMILIQVWTHTGAENIGRLIDMVVASLLTALVSNRNRTQAPSIDNSITTDVIKTPIVKAETMPDATVNVNKKEDLEIGAGKKGGIDLSKDLNKD